MIEASSDNKQCDCSVKTAIETKTLEH